LFLRPRTNHEALADSSEPFIRFRPNTVQIRRLSGKTVCYDRFRSLTVLIAWGYSVQVFKGNVLLPDLLAVQKTFVPWKRGRNVTDVYMFDTKHYPRDECKSATLFFLKSVSSSEGKAETTYTRQTSRKCLPDLIPLSKVHLIKVTSEQLHLVPGKVCLEGICFHQMTSYTSQFENCRYDSIFSGFTKTVL
jgi:hypothetical protein